MKKILHFLSISAVIAIGFTVGNEANAFNAASDLARAHMDCLCGRGCGGFPQGAAERCSRDGCKAACMQAGPGCSTINPPDYCDVCAETTCR